MAQYLLDTDVCIEIIKQNERVLDKVEAVGEENCFVTDITIAELFYGAAKSGRLDHFEDVEKTLTLIATKRGALKKGGIPDYDRVYDIIVKDLKSNMFGNITLDRMGD